MVDEVAKLEPLARQGECETPSTEAQLEAQLAVPRAVEAELRGLEELERAGATGTAREPLKADAPGANTAGVQAPARPR